MTATDLYTRRTTPGGRVRYELAGALCPDLPRGRTLVVAVEPGVVSYRPVGEHDRAEVLAAVEELGHAMLAAMVEAMRHRPLTRPSTEAERAAWEAYCDTYERMTGERPRDLLLTRASLAEVVEAGTAVLRERAR